MSQLVLLPLQLLLALGVPALIAWRAPPRWRLWAIALWTLAPFLLALMAWWSEAASATAGPAEVDKLVYGLLLIGSFLALPWLMACGLGYALGAALRGRGPPEPAPAGPALAGPATAVRSEPAPWSPPPADPDMPTLTLPGEWQAIHVGFDNDDLTLQGLPVWSVKWREEPGDPVMLAHPAHPAQQHAFTVYQAQDAFRSVRFAAAELSNGVWGFYQWTIPIDAGSGASADGSLRFEHDRRDGSYVPMPLARLCDARTGAWLFDGAAWTSSRVVPQVDGSLLLSLIQADKETLYRIDPPARSFRDLASTDGDRSLAELAEAATAARAGWNGADKTYLKRSVAPDGAIVVDFEAAEWGNSHWVHAPRVIETATGRVLLDLWGTDWDATVRFPRRRTVHLSFRRYHAGGGADVEIDLGGECYVLFEPPGPTTGPLAELGPALEQASRRSAALAGPRPVIHDQPPIVLSWFRGLLILAGALVLIAVATYVTLLFDEPKAQKLDTIPPMPSDFARPGR